MVAHYVKKDNCAFHLAPNLIDKAQQAYAAISAEDAANYDQVKETILQRCNINTETYRQRFWSITKKSDWSFRDLVVSTRLGT